MNFVIFPMFFTSSALYPLWRIKDSSALLYHLASWNPFTHAVELIRHALYLEFNPQSLAVVAGCFLVFMGLAVIGYDPGRGMMAKRGPGAS
jgi:ABC-2 type transport system permease protein